MIICLPSSGAASLVCIASLLTYSVAFELCHPGPAPISGPNWMRLFRLPSYGNAVHSEGWSVLNVSTTGTDWPSEIMDTERPLPCSLRTEIEQNREMCDVVMLPYILQVRLKDMTEH